MFDLPRIQYHRFEAWDVSPNACHRCGQLPQAHPAPSVSDADLARWQAEDQAARSSAQAPEDDREQH